MGASFLWSMNSWSSSVLLVSGSYPPQWGCISMATSKIWYSWLLVTVVKVLGTQHGHHEVLELEGLAQLFQAEPVL